MDQREKEIVMDRVSVLSTEDVRTIIEQAPGRLSEVFAQINRELKDQGKEQKLGGYFALASALPDGGPPLAVLKVGAQPLDSAEKSYGFCQEKVERLRLNPGHLTSSQSRDPDKERYGGAVVIPRLRLIFSYSGFPEEYDEKGMISFLNPNYWRGKINFVPEFEEVGAIRVASEGVYHPESLA